MRCKHPISPRGQPVPCGKCNFCLSNGRGDWTFRLKQELKSNVSAIFLTLTYDNEHLVYGNSELPTLNKYDLRGFIKKIRNYERTIPEHSRHRSTVRYYACGEYGSETERPHYHAIMFGLQMQTIGQLPLLWDKGNIHIGRVTGASIHYTTKYVITRQKKYEGRQKPFNAISNRSGGLGKNYLINADLHIKNAQTFIRNAEGIQRLPRYYKERIFTDPEQKQMMYEETDKQLREQYKKEIQRLARIHPHPTRYYQEIQDYHYDNLTKRLTKTETI
ncbi:MAG: replication initiator protein [Microviridae sp.]|nr:MAG: replication initiator protein [Microviridae sp.]